MERIKKFKEWTLISEEEFFKNKFGQKYRKNLDKRTVDTSTGPTRDDIEWERNREKNRQIKIASFIKNISPTFYQFFKDYESDVAIPTHFNDMFEKIHRIIRDKGHISRLVNIQRFLKSSESEITAMIDKETRQAELFGTGLVEIEPPRKRPRIKRAEKLAKKYITNPEETAQKFPEIFGREAGDPLGTLFIYNDFFVKYLSWAQKISDDKIQNTDTISLIRYYDGENLMEIQDKVFTEVYDSVYKEMIKFSSADIFESSFDVLQPNKYSIIVKVLTTYGIKSK